MSVAVEDAEISMLSLMMAKSLVCQAVTNVNDDTNDTENTDTITQNLETDSLPSLKAPPMKINSFAFRQSSKEFLESWGDAGLLSNQILNPPKAKLDIQETLPDTYADDFVPSEYQLDEDTVTGTVDNRNEQSISKIFEKRDDFSESSMFPFSMLGESPEMLSQKYTREGYLYKKSSSMLLGWQKRYFEVRGFKIYYSKTIEMLRARKEVRCINLFVNPCEVTDIKGQTFQISVDGVKKKLWLKATSLAEAKIWVEFLQSVFKFIKDHQAQASKYITAKRERLLKIDVLTEEEFLDKVETGDLLLFKSVHFAAKLQRTVTYSKYDHVGLTVRAFDDVYLYDSVYNGGVQLTHWNDFKKHEYYKDYMRIAYRKLDIKDEALKKQIQENLFTFVTEHTGKKYELSLKKLLKRTSLGPEKIQKNLKPGAQEEGFFCSELVAAAYKAVGLLDPFVASSRYLPVSFSQKKALKLLRDSSLSSEYALALTDKKQIKK